MATPTIDPGTGAWKWTNPATGMVLFYDSRVMQWQYLQPGTTSDWRWFTTGMKTSRPSPAPAGAPAPLPPAVTPAATTPVDAASVTPASQPDEAAASPTPGPRPRLSVLTSQSPETPSTTPSGVVTAPKETGMTRTKMVFGAIAALLLLLLGGALGNALFSGKTTVAGDGSALSERRVADIAGATFDQRVKPVTDDIAKLQKQTADLANGLATLDTKVGKVETNVMAGIKDVLERLKNAPATTTPAPANPAVSALAQQRMAMVQRECLPEDQKDVTLESLGEGLDQTSFDAQIAHCRSNKLSTRRMVSPPPAAGRPQVAQNDLQDDPEATDEDPEAQANGQPRAQPVGYGGGHRQGARRCEPGTRPAGSFGCVGRTITNRAETQVFDQRIKSGCVPGATRTIWKEGVDPQGRNVRYQVKQHSECGPRQRGY